MKKKPLFDDDEVLVNENGLFVFTENYLLQRGYCCGSGCRNCPFDYKNVIDESKKARLLNEQKNRKPHA
ncbi:MAG: hypothetical protein RIQ62_477 [Bacteroidota bacterium]